jgi:transposase
MGHTAKQLEPELGLLNRPKFIRDIFVTRKCNITNVHSKENLRIKGYPDDVKQQTIELFNSMRKDYKSASATAKAVCEMTSIRSFETILRWTRQERIDSGVSAGLTTADLEEMRKLKRRIKELERANGILKAASAFFAAELDRPVK